MSSLEFKYLVPCDELDKLRRALSPFVAIDPFAKIEPTGEYTVRSIYYDTPGLDCYAQKEAGIYRRRKIRIRGYGAHRGDGLVVLEIKRKFDMRVSKNRAFVFYARLEELLASGDVERFVLGRHSYLQEQARQNARAFLFHLYRFSMYPVALVTYEREAFFSKFDPSVRITFDKGLRGRIHPTPDDLFTDDGLTGVMSRNFILEIKFPGTLPSWFVSILAEFELERRPLSKYVLCLDNERLEPRVSSRSAWAARLPSGRQTQSWKYFRTCSSWQRSA